MLPTKVREAVRELLREQARRLLAQLRLGPDPMVDALAAETARSIGDTGSMLDPELAAGAVMARYDRAARRFAKVCVWDGECEADATTDDGLCAAHAAEQAREDAETMAMIARGSTSDS